MSANEHREFWTAVNDDYDMFVAVTLTPEAASTVWNAMRLAGVPIIMREHESGRYKGRFVMGWSKEDGYFHAESPDEDPGSKHRGTHDDGLPSSPESDSGLRGGLSPGEGSTA